MAKARDDIPGGVIVTCSTCHERFAVRAGKKAATVACTFCGAKVRVPTVEEAAAWVAPPISKNVRDVGEYKVNAPVETMVMPPTHFFEKRAEIKQVEFDEPAAWTFFSDVYNVPWRGDVVLRWAFLTAGCLAVFLVAHLILSLSQTASGPGGAVMAFFALPEIWLSVWTFSYMAACFLRVLIDTAAGINRITSWPEPNWREWAGQLMYVGWLLFVSAIVGYGAGHITTAAGGDRSAFWLTVLVTTFFTFPIVLLSALEADSVLLPFSSPILRSLTRLWWGWFVCYFLAGLLFGGWLALTIAGYMWQPLVTVFLAAPLLPAVVLIYARLLGRLAWKASEMEPPQSTRA